MRQTNTALLLLATLLTSPTSILAATPAFFAVRGVSGTDSLALRTQPTVNSASVARIPFNAVQLKNLGKRSNGWCQIQYQGKVGWSACKYLTESDGRRYYASSNTKPLHIVKSPNRLAAKTGVLPAYATGIEGLDTCSTTWCRINYQGARGWVERRYLASWAF